MNKLGAPARDAIFIVGMGRSGSSAIARVMALCGGALPLQMLPPNHGNPTGYWEPQHALEINDAFLLAHSSSWYDPGLALQLNPPSAAVSRLVTDIAAFLPSGFGDGPIVLKEPRISGLLPYWTLGARECGFTVKVIHIFRNPGDVASSLAARDGLPAADSWALWLKYNLLAERDTRHEPRIFIAYEDLMSDWESVTSRCIRRLRLEAAIDDQTRDSVARFLSRDLQHHRATTLEKTRAVDPVLLGRVQRVYELLLEARSDAIRSGELDAIFAGLAESWLTENRPVF